MRLQPEDHDTYIARRTQMAMGAIEAWERDSAAVVSLPLGQLGRARLSAAEARKVLGFE